MQQAFERAGLFFRLWQDAVRAPFRRGGIEAALARVQARTLVVDVDSDRLFLPAQAEELAGGIPGARRETISSLHGHDGFLIEAEQMDAILRDFLAGA